jgi:hypothetical protein
MCMFCACFVLVLCFLCDFACVFYFVHVLCLFCAVLCRNLAQQRCPFSLKNFFACLAVPFCAVFVPSLFQPLFKEFYEIHIYVFATFVLISVPILCLFLCFFSLNFFICSYIFGNFVPTLCLLFCTSVSSERVATGCLVLRCCYYYFVYVVGRVGAASSIGRKSKKEVVVHAKKG